MRKKGLSLEEKQKRLLEAIRNSNQFFIFKEIEKLGTAKGIVLQSIKDVLQTLIDENLVQTDKVGSQNIYWSLKSDAKAKFRRERDEKLQKIEELRKKKDVLQKQVDSQQSEEFRKKIELLQSISLTEKDILRTQEFLSSAADSHPSKIKELESQKNAILQSISRFLIETVYINELSHIFKIIRYEDNVYNLKRWMCQKLFMTEEFINSYFKIPAELH